MSALVFIPPLESDLFFTKNLIIRYINGCHIETENKLKLRLVRSSALVCTVSRHSRTAGRRMKCPIVEQDLALLAQLLVRFTPHARTHTHTSVTRHQSGVRVIRLHAGYECMSDSARLTETD